MARERKCKHCGAVLVDGDAADEHFAGFHPATKEGEAAAEKIAEGKPTGRGGRVVARRGEAPDVVEETPEGEIVDTEPTPDEEGGTDG